MRAVVLVILGARLMSERIFCIFATWDDLGYIFNTPQ